MRPVGTLVAVAVAVVLVGCAPTTSPPDAHGSDHAGDVGFEAALDAACGDLLVELDTYAAAAGATSDGVKARWQHFADTLKDLPDPGDTTWPAELVALHSAARSARGDAEERSSSVWAFIGGARAHGLVTCGHAAQERFASAFATTPATDGAQTRDGYARAFATALEAFLAAHEEYHSSTYSDADEIAGRLLDAPTPATRHGAGFLVLLDGFTDTLGEVAPPDETETEARAALAFFLLAHQWFERGVALGPGGGEVAFEIGFLDEWQAVGAACLAGVGVLCP